MMIRSRYSALALFILTFSIIAVSDGGDFIRLPSEARRFFDGDDVGTRWAILLAGSNGYWNYRHQMVLQLKLQPAEEPIHPRRAFDVDGPGGLFLEPVVPLGQAHVDVGGEVVERELDVLDGTDAEAG
ncbi:hypothetical protein SASPL_116883 [Salvia splendens]|uniref:Uncharacterized protein n=1 Tax=Salvia splendens TaxID=180675 RepID=A0A8X8ZX89_SALSN|nr:hypothetical protein SASPL_116883 [Salvia splendens]